MDFRLAKMRDLLYIKDMFNEIIDKMNQDGIEIWDDIYPCSFFEDDIKNNRLYILLDGTEIVAALALCATSSGEGFVKWEKDCGRVIYIDRLGVNVKYRGKGIGSLLLTNIKKTARDLGAEYLRLFVVDKNVPAVNLYSKNGFIRAKGMYNEVIDEDCILHEYGYEILL